jgi:hypothetical protein
MVDVRLEGPWEEQLGRKEQTSKVEGVVQERTKTGRDEGVCGFSRFHTGKGESEKSAPNLHHGRGRADKESLVEWCRCVFIGPLDASFDPD